MQPAARSRAAFTRQQTNQSGQTRFGGVPARHVRLTCAAVQPYNASMNLKLHSLDLCSWVPGTVATLALAVMAGGASAAAQNQPQSTDTSTVETKAESPAESMTRSWKLLTD